MPRAHRDTDSRFCGASTMVIGQSTVYVNNLLWAVKDDPDDHCGMGELVPEVGLTVEIEGKLIICAVGDSAKEDYEGCITVHPPGATNPSGGSGDTFVYEGGTGGGAVS